MDGNIANGGLVIQFEHNNIISDFGKYWFMNADDEYVYYSDGTRDNYLCRMSKDDPDGSVILKRSCANVVLDGDWLYYINESDHRIYRCLRVGRSESLITREEVTEFVMYGKTDVIYAPVTGGLRSTSQVLNNDVKPVMLCALGSKLFFADGANNFYLTCIDLNPENGYRKACIGQIVPRYINCYGCFIYFTDAFNGNNIYKLNIEGGAPIRISKESANYLHVIDNYMFFWNGSVWKYIPLDGGDAKEVGL